jgi:AmmeMemoRadiSam system protein A
VLPLTEVDERALLHLARQALEDAARHRHLSDLEAPAGVLGENCGAFVTLHKGRRLRGCIGYVEASKPLYETVRECALAAALHDPRFDPVTADELTALRLEISVLSPLREILPDQIEPGFHGLMVSLGHRRGLLLPQVAVEWKWDRIRFLEEVCAKAGLPRDAWRQGAKVQAFTAQVFAEPLDPAGSAPHAA